MRMCKRPGALKSKASSSRRWQLPRRRRLPNLKQTQEKARHRRCGLRRNFLRITTNHPGLNLTMKKFCILIAALALCVSCDKPQSEEEKKAEVERQVQERLATERQAEEQQRLAQQKADLEAREKALADKEATTTASTAVEEPVETTESTTETTRRTRETSETRSTASYGTFYRKLEPYGAWRETADYGFVWQPREAEESRSWRPYTEGRWVYSDAGWTWVSDEPFGWATYHYGRWTRLRGIGWVWVPGEEWAPAWVSWRTSNDYVGWAPLPPEARFDHRRGIHNWADNYYEIGPDQYSFVRGSDFGSEQVRRAVIPTDRNVTIVNETTNVTNITYANTMVVNHGPNYDEMRSRSQRPIERYRLRRQREMRGDTARATVRGDEIEVTMPVIGAEPGMDRPHNVRERVAQVVVDNGWSGISDRSAAEKARTKMKAESTPPPDAPSKTFVKPEPTTAASAPPASPAATAAMPAATATATPASEATASLAPPPPTASPTVRSRTTPTATPSAFAAPSVSARPSVTASPALSARPSATATPAPSVSASPSLTPRPAATSTPLPSVSPAVSVRPSASPALQPSPSAPGASTPPLRAVTPPPSPASTESPAIQAEEPRGSSESERSSAAQRVERERKIEEIRKRRSLPPGAAAPGVSASPAAVSDAVEPNAPGPANTPPRRIPPTANPSPSLATSPPPAKEAVKPLPLYTPGEKPPAPDRRVPPAAASKPAAMAPASPAPAGGSRRVPPAAGTTSPATSPTPTPTPTAAAQ